MPQLLTSFRKVMQCAIERGDYPAAAAALRNMPASSKAESFTRFLAYKLAIRNQDQDLGRQYMSLPRLELMHAISIRMSRTPQ